VNELDKNSVKWSKVFKALSENKPICPICFKRMKKVDAYTWKFNCKCSKKDLRLSLG
jgi:tRNA(Ile2) C34 agmatinyltransferase TiaS